MCPQNHQKIKIFKIVNNSNGFVENQQNAKQRANRCKIEEDIKRLERTSNRIPTRITRLLDCQTTISPTSNRRCCCCYCCCNLLCRLIRQNFGKKLAENWFEKGAKRAKTLLSSTLLSPKSSSESIDLFGEWENRFLFLSFTIIFLFSFVLGFIRDNRRRQRCFSGSSLNRRDIRQNRKIKINLI